MYTPTPTHTGVWGPAEVNHGWDPEEQGSVQAGRLQEIIISIHFTASFLPGGVSLMFPSLYRRHHISSPAALQPPTFHPISASFYRTRLLLFTCAAFPNPSCDRLDFFCFVFGSTLIVHNTLMTTTVTLVTGGCAGEFSEGGN